MCCISKILKVNEQYTFYGKLKIKDNRYTFANPLFEEKGAKRDYIPDINLQILNIADKYSALTEKRVYKEALTPKQALTIIYSDVKKGNVHPFLFQALVKAVTPPQPAKIYN